jgi:hypothetical protein
MDDKKIECIKSSYSFRLIAESKSESILLNFESISILLRNALVLIYFAGNSDHG